MKAESKYKIIGVLVVIALFSFILVGTINSNYDEEPKEDTVATEKREQELTEEQTRIEKQRLFYRIENYQEQLAVDRYDWSLENISEVSIDQLIQAANELEQEVEQASEQEVEYRIVEERDISYINCKRIAVSVLVPDDAIPVSVENTLELLARDYLIDWDDVTVWAWGYSEESQVGKIPATKGTVEESLPGFCS